VAGAASAILFAIDGNNIDNCMADLPSSISPCAHQRTTLVPGLITAGVSAAAIVGGIVYLVHGSEDHPGVALTLQPFGLSLGGRL
jgi:hypothetical protein